MSPTPETDSSIESFNDIITKDFLQAVIKHETNSSSPVEIVSHNVTYGTKPGDNFLSIIYAVDVDIKVDASSAPKRRHLLIKCYPNHPGRQIYSNKSNMFFKELEIYNKWMPELKRFQKEVVGLDESQVLRLPYAKYVHGECIDFDSAEGQAKKSSTVASLDNFIVMEDLKKEGFRMTNRRNSLDFDHTLLVINELAKIHALSHAYRHHVEKHITQKFPCLVPNFDEEDIAQWSPVLYGNLDQAVKIFDKEFGTGNNYTAAITAFRDQVQKVMEVFNAKESEEGLDKMLPIKPDPKRFGKDAENPKPWRVIGHGDCWSNNFLYRYDSVTGLPVEVVLVDLQMAKESCLTNDLQYVIYACTDGHLRRAYLNSLLQVYHDKFNECCELLKAPTLPGFCMDSLKYRFHRSKLVGFFLANMILPIMLKEEEGAVNLEELDPSLTAEEAFSDIFKGMEENKAYKERIMDVTKDMIDDGVFYCKK